MKLSVVTTLYQSAFYVKEFYARVTTVAKQLFDEDYEIIFVNDGSPDNSLELAVQLVDADSHVIVIDLSRNFGHHKAMMTGLSYAKGDLVFLIDSDLEEEPEWLLQFHDQMQKDHCDVVYGVQARRKGGFFERWSGEVFYYLFNKLTNIGLAKNIVTARLMVREYVRALMRHREREVFIAGLWHITGFDQRPSVIRKYSSSESSYTLKKKILLFLNAVTSFSSAPLVFIFYLGVAISLITVLYVAYLVANWLFLATPPSGWTSVMVSIWFIGGLIISFIGIIGVYLSKMFIEVKQRPYTIVKRIYSK